MYLKWYLVPESVPQENINAWFNSEQWGKDPQKGKTLHIQKDVLYELRKHLFRPLPCSVEYNKLMQGWIIVRFCSTPQRLKRSDLKLMFNYLNYIIPYVYHPLLQFVCKSIINFINDCLENILDYDVFFDF